MWGKTIRGSPRINSRTLELNNILEANSPVNMYYTDVKIQMINEAKNTWHSIVGDLNLRYVSTKPAVCITSCLRSFPNYTKSNLGLWAASNSNGYLTSSSLIVKGIGILRSNCGSLFILAPYREKRIRSRNAKAEIMFCIGLTPSCGPFFWVFSL